MPRRVLPADSVVELRLLRRHVSLDPFSAHLDTSRAAVGHWLAGTRPAPPLTLAALKHLDERDAIAYAADLLSEAGIDVGDVLREMARREVRQQVLLELAGELVDQAEALPMRRAA